jgi:hypothetical protein
MEVIQNSNLDARSETQIEISGLSQGVTKIDNFGPAVHLNHQNAIHYQ